MNFSLNRRNLLKGTAALGLSSLPMRSASAAEEPVLNIYSWDSYLAENTIANFKAATGIDAKVDIYGSNDELFAKLKGGNPGYDLILPSANWIERMIKSDMLQPLDHGKIPNIGNYDPAFMTGAGFDEGRKHSLTYVWGTFGIGYRKSKAAAGAPNSWMYLLTKPEFAGKISIQADQEYAFGVALQALGFSWNSKDAGELSKAKDLLIEAKKNIKLFAKDNGQDLLASGDVDICGEYAGDVLSVMASDADLDYILPSEGGNTWQDCMAIAKGAPHPENAHAYINYICDAKVNAELMAAINYATPNAAAKAIMADDYTKNPAIFPPAEVLAKAEPSLYLGEDAVSAREELWTAVQAA